ncbi:peptidase M23B [Mesorhizobium sp. LNHC252B00]|nr:peptidase M23B [Mesorhizobium sp. LNHC252B00]
MHAKLVTGAMLIVMSALLQPASAAPDWETIAKALGKSGTETPDGVYRVGLPRTDLKVSLDGISLNPGFALGGWIAFEPKRDQAMVMGDIVLTQDEVNPVMKKLEEGGIEITAVHNHLLRAEPMTLYVHVLGQGDPVTLATALHAGLALSKTPMGGGAQPQAAPQIEFDTASVDQTIGYKGNANGAVYQFTIPRAKPVEENGMEVPAAMGSAIAINFQSTGGGKAAITGDFVLTAKEVNPVINVMQDNGIEITALHSHMLDEKPRLFFMHFWANDDAQKLAKGLRAALDKVAVKKS